MTPRDIFLAAAESILDGSNTAACFAIKNAVLDAQESWLLWAHCYQLFGDLFKPECPSVLWWRRGDRESRVIALLLAAEISKTYKP